MNIKPHGLFSVWSPDQVAECLEGVDDALYSALWGLVSRYEGATRSECNDDFADRALENWWNELSEEHQTKLNVLAAREEAKWKSYGPQELDQPNENHQKCLHCGAYTDECQCSGSYPE